VNDLTAPDLVHGLFIAAFACGFMAATADRRDAQIQFVLWIVLTVLLVAGGCAMWLLTEGQS
jgi:hypothetical protein